MKEKSNIISIFSIILVMFYPCYFMYCSNVEEASISSIGIISLCFIIVALIFLSIINIFIKNIHKSALIVNTMMLIFLNYNIIYISLIKILPFLSYNFFLYLCAGIISAIGAFIHYSRGDTVTISKIINKGIFIAFLALILMNFFISLPTVIEKINFKAKNSYENYDNYESAGNAGAEENIYYFIFDEYAGSECLQRYCDYQNDEFYENLREIGFNVSETSHSETITTNIVIANLFNFDNVASYDTIKDERKQYIQEPELYNIIKENNYKLNIVNDGSFLGENGIDYKYDATTTKQNFVNSVPYYILQNTILYPSIMYIYDWDKDRIPYFLGSIDYVEEFVNQEHNSVFTLYFSDMMHGPWIVDEEGNREKTLYYDWDNPNKYIEQMKYTQNNILDLFRYIIENDPNSIIIIQGDHGYRQPFHIELFGGEEMEDYDLEMHYMTNSMNSVYYKGEELDIEGMSIYNTLKLVINKLWNTNLEYKEYQITLAPFDEAR